jgi:GTP-binding protein
MQALGERRSELAHMEPDGMGRVRLDYRIPARGLIGFQNEFLNLTRGTGLISNIFDGYEPYKGEIEGRKNGVLISQDDGEAVTYSLGKLDDRGRMFVKAGDPFYEAWSSASTRATTTWSSTRCAASSSPTSASPARKDAIKITPPIILTLEYAVEFIADDELVEITPKSIRIRKRT